MVTQELLDYIKTALASGQSREAITQALIQNGWAAGDVQEGLTAVTGEVVPLQQSQEAVTHTPTQPQETTSVNSGYAQAQPENQIRPQNAPTRSILPMAIIAGTAVIIVGIAATFWILTKNSTDSSQLAVEQTTPVKATTTDQNPQVLATTSSQAQLSEIDKYGVDLYALKQGETKTTVEIGGKPTVVTYTRKDKIIERCISGGCSEIDLDAKINLEKKLAELDATIKSKCTAGSTHPDCSSAPLIYKEMKTCSSFQKSEDISRCTTQAMLKGFSGAYNQPMEPVVSKEAIPFNRTSVEKELSSLAEEGRLPSVVAKAEEEQSKICIGGRENTVDCVQGRLMLSAVKSNCPNLEDIQKMKACIPAVVSALEKMVNDYNNS